MAGVTNREFWDFRVKTRAQFTKLAEQIANIDTSGGGGISELTSKMVVDALGYTPYNANNPANYITASALTPYALKTDIPSLVGYATEDFVNSKLGDYATKDYVTTKLVDYAPLTSVQGFENRIKGLEGAITKKADSATTLSGYGITDAYTKIDVDKLLEDNATKTWVNASLVNYATVNSVTTIKNTLTGQIGTVSTNLSTLQTTVSNQAKTILANEQGLEELRTTVGDLGDAIPTNNNQLDNGAGYITSAALAPYALRSEIPSLVGYATQSWVGDNFLSKSGGKLTGQLIVKDSGSSIEVHRTQSLAPVIKFSNVDGQLGHIGINNSDGRPLFIDPHTNFHTFAFTSDIPTKLSDLTDDVVAEKYLPLNGGTINSTAVQPLYLKNNQSSCGILFFNSTDNATLMYSGGSNWRVTDNGWSNAYYLIHSGNIGNYKAGDSNKLGGKSKDYYIGQNLEVSQVIDINAIERNHIIHGNKWSHNLSGTIASVLDISYSADWRSQLLFNSNTKKIYSRFFVEGYLWSDWQQIAFITDNVESATKLATARTLWGQSFDGTKNISGAITLPNNTPINVTNSAGTSANNALLMTTGDNLYLGYGTAVYNGSDTYIWGKNIKFTNKSGQVIGSFSNDKLGIGVENPSEKLDVAGNVKASGNINATSITINGVTITASNGSITVNGNVFATGDITGGV